MKPLSHIAVLSDGERTYRAESPAESIPLRSAPVVLIQGIYHLHPNQARRILRNRIYTTVGPSKSLSGITKVSAKRITTSMDRSDPVFQKTPQNACLIEITPEQIWKPEPIQIQSPASCDIDFMKIALELANRIPRKGERYASDRPVAALLVSKENEVLGAAVNTNAKNRTLHAEINLIDRFVQKYERLIPSGATLYTTLKPCKMCAGMIYDCAQDLSNLRVLYAENDPGSNAQYTALDTCALPVQSQLITAF